MTHLLYLKKDYEQVERETREEEEYAYDEDTHLLSQANEKPRVKPLVIVNTGRHLTNAWNMTYRYQFCKECKQVQPPRTYHCSQCNECVLRMDHHCIWLGTCIGLMNVKYYWQFLLYSCISMLIMAISVLSIAGFHLLAVVGLVFFIDFAVLLIY